MLATNMHTMRTRNVLWKVKGGCLTIEKGVCLSSEMTDLCGGAECVFC